MIWLRRKGGTSNKLIMIFISVIVIAICIFFRYKARDIKAQNAKDTTQIESLKGEIDNEHDRTEELEEYAKYVKTKQFVELMARNKLGLVYPNEVIFKNEE